MGESKERKCIMFGAIAAAYLSGGIPEKKAIEAAANNTQTPFDKKKFRAELSRLVGLGMDFSAISGEQDTPKGISAAPCELCNNTGYYGDNGPGRAGNAECHECDQCTVSERCMRSGFRDCVGCEDFSCGDNMNAKNPELLK